MARREKTRTYGKRRGNDLVAAFDTLSISPSLSTQAKPTAETKILARAGSKVAVPSPKTDDIENKLEHEDCYELLAEKPTLPRSETERIRARQPLKDIYTDHEQPRWRGRKPKTQQTQSNDPLTHTRSERQNATKHNPAPPRPSPEIISLLSLPYIHSTIYDFSFQYTIWARTFTFTKLAQGSYASILRLSLISNPDIYTIWKLIPLKASSGKGSRLEGATIFEDAIAEVKLLEAMSKSPGFVEFRSAQVLRGDVPERLRVVEEEWEKGLTRKEREDLGERKEYGCEQLWLFIEMTDAGTDLESWFKKRRADRERRFETDAHDSNHGSINILEAWNIFWGIVEALAHGEEHSEFEHRDLHPGNVCVKSRKSSASEDSLLEQRQSLVQRHTDIEVTLIDYTLSRAAVQSQNVGIEDEESCVGDKEILANSMRDKAIFTQESKIPIDQMQYDTYRQMRKIMHHHHTSERRKEGWQSFMPMTNVLWLHHILTIILKETGIFNGTWDVISKLPGAEQGRAVSRLSDIRQAIDPRGMLKWEYRSATELLEAEIFRDEHSA